MSDPEYRHRDGLFVSAVDLDRGATTVHVYDEDKPADGFTSGLLRTSLCGQSWRKVSQGRSLTANRDEVDCGTCQNILPTARGGV